LGVREPQLRAAGSRPSALGSRHEFGSERRAGARALDLPYPAKVNLDAVRALKGGAAAQARFRIRAEA
jgi:hypothetical protein